MLHSKLSQPQFKIVFVHPKDQEKEDWKAEVVDELDVVAHELEKWRDRTKLS